MSTSISLSLLNSNVQPQRLSTMAEKSSTKSTLAEEMRDALIELGGPCNTNERQRWLERVAWRADISFRAAKTIFYREKEYPGSRVVERIRNARDRRKDGYDKIFERFASLEAAMRETDPEFFAIIIDALKQAARRNCDQESEDGPQVG